MSETDHLLDLIGQALDEFEDVTLSASARRALRIAQLRGDSVDVWWLYKDLKPMGGSKALLVDEVTSLWPDEDYDTVRSRHEKLVDQWIDEHRVIRVPSALLGKMKEGSMIHGSIAELEQYCSSMRRELHELDPEMRSMKLSAAFLAAIQLREDVLGRTRHRVHSYLCRCERETVYGATNASIFDRHRRRVDGHLKKLAPDVLERMNAAYLRSQDGDAESRSQALMSCRRVLKSVADRVYPARDEPIRDAQGRTYDVGEDRYRNRLWQFMSEVAEHRTAAKLFHGTLEDFGHRIDLLDDLSSKGVHDDVTQSEVDQCVIQTYLLTGETLQLADALTDT